MALRGEVGALTCRARAEFVNLLSSEANEQCEKGKKKTVGPEHVLEAMEVRAARSPLATPLRGLSGLASGARLFSLFTRRERRARGVES